MNNKELVNKILKFWLKENNKYDSKQLKKNIEKKLSSIDGIEHELDYIRVEFDCIDETNDLYSELGEIWDELNYYKSDFEKEVLNCYE